MKNITFLVSGEKKTIGGNKIIYQYSNYINTLPNYSSDIIHIKKKRGKKWINSINKRLFKKKIIKNHWDFNDVTIETKPYFQWTGIKIKTKQNFNFDQKKHHVVLPEIYAHFANDFLIKKRISYSIFVQNGYAIFSTNNFKQLKKAYQNAKYILVYSQDIKKCILLAFPMFKNKILKVKYSIDFKKFKFNKKKRNIITYMPRKLPNHSSLVISFLKNNLPKKWKIISIQNLEEKKVFDILNKSKIFLAFSSLEGLPLPPVEAAMAGNKVIGYTGEGGKEYWKKPIFIEVKTSEIKNFCNKILSNLNFNNFLKKSLGQRKLLAKQFSTEIEKKYILNYLKKI